MSLQGCLLALTDKPADAVNKITAGIAAFRSTGATCFLPLYLAFLARANAALGNSDDAQRSIQEALQAIAKSKERWCEAEVYRTAGEIALEPPAPEERKAEEYFDRALAVARAQQAKSWELRAAMSLARLWRERGSPEQARELLAPIYDSFTEGFETVDLQEAKNIPARRSGVIESSTTAKIHFLISSPTSAIPSSHSRPAPLGCWNPITTGDLRGRSMSASGGLVIELVGAAPPIPPKAALLRTARCGSQGAKRQLPPALLRCL